MSYLLTQLYKFSADIAPYPDFPPGRYSDGALSYICCGGCCCGLFLLIIAIIVIVILAAKKKK